LNRKIHKAYLRVKELNFDISGFLGFDLYNKVAGVIGTGNIGKIVAKILSLGFDMKVLCYDIKPDYKFAETIRARYTDLDEIFSTSDIITLHCPLNKETYHILNKQSFEKMKKGVMIINTSRGEVINTRALIRHIDRLGGVALDVLEQEPPRDELFRRLIAHPKVIVTPHIGAETRESMDRIAEELLNNILDAVKWL